MDDVQHAGAPLGAPFEGTAEDFFRRIEESGVLPVGVDAREAASSVVCALLARLDLEQGREVLDALPAGVDEAIGRCPIHAGLLAEALDERAFLARIGQHLQLEPEGVQAMTAAVLQALAATLPPRPAGIVERELPAELRALIFRRL